jgi:cell division protein FtsI/penicillin-binding protein 2
MLVVIDPLTGEVLSLASTPGYNPNDYGDSEVDARRDRVVTDRFEPGSVMKVFTDLGGAGVGLAQADRADLLREGLATSSRT